MWTLTTLRQCLKGFSLWSYSSLPFHTTLSGSKSLTSGSHLRNRELYSTSLRAMQPHKLFEILLHQRLAYSHPLIYSIIYFYQYRLTNTWLSVILNQNLWRNLWRMVNDPAEGTKSKLTFCRKVRYWEGSIFVWWNLKDHEPEAPKCWTTEIRATAGSQNTEIIWKSA